jgi:uncharacterized protein
VSARRSLRPAPGVRFDADVAGGWTFGVLAKKGAGKTYTGRVMAEELHAARVPFVAIDPTGAWWGLRSGADGEKKGGLPVLVAGGDSPVRDLPLERGGGAVMADLVVDEAVPMVLDLSALGSHAAEREFAHGFFERLYRRNRELVHVFVDEADLFAPQSPQPGDRPLLGVMENIVRRGRIKGIGVTLITQRAAVLNKDVLTQVDVLALLRVTGPQDRAAIEKWVAGHGDAERQRQVLDSLAGLQNGESWWWAPEIDLFARAQVRAARTFDSSPTPRRGQRRREPRSFADLDVSAISAKLAETVERQKADDPKALRATIRRLERELSNAQRREPERVVETVEVPVVADEQLERLEYFAGELAPIAQDLVAAARDIQAALARTRQQPSPRTTAPTPAPAARVTPPAGEDRARPDAIAVDVDVDFRPSGPQQRVLDALAWLAAIGFSQPTKIQVGFIAGYRVGKKVGGTYGNVLGQLRAAGMIDYPSVGAVSLTRAGQALSCTPDIEPTDEGLQQAVFARLDGPEARVLRVLIDAYPHALSKQEAGERAGYTVGEKVGGTYGNVLGRLRSLGLVEYPQPGQVVALSILFPSEVSHGV